MKKAALIVLILGIVLSSAAFADSNASTGGSPSSTSGTAVNATGSSTSAPANTSGNETVAANIPAAAPASNVTPPVSANVDYSERPAYLKDENTYNYDRSSSRHWYNPVSWFHHNHTDVNT